MITLVTGTPGAGKTLWTIRELVDKIAPSGRPVFTNINGLDVDKIGTDVTIIEDEDALDWMKYPDGAVFIFDEVQHQFPPRHAGAKLPAAIQALQTHRHRGMDFFLVTQEPSLIDKAVRVLVGRHVHLYRAFNLARSQVFEWPTVNPEPNPAHNHKMSDRKQFIFPKRLYSLYKSSVEHTHKARVPKGIILLMLSGFALAICGSWYGFSAIAGGKEDAELTGTLNQVEGNSASSVGPADTRLSCSIKGRMGDWYFLATDANRTFAVRRDSVFDTCRNAY